MCLLIYKLPKLCILLAIFLIAFTSSSARAQNDSLIEALQNAPDWPNANSENITSVDKQLMPVMAKICLLTVGECRLFEQQFLAKMQEENRNRVSDWSRLYILNRAYFAVPQTPSSNPRLGGWVLNKADGSPLWPLSYGTDGALHLTGIFSGYSGANYRALYEFDLFSKNYGKRSR
jgi:hypothetical protein